jgi:hypothetical protein
LKHKGCLSGKVLLRLTVLDARGECPDIDAVVSRRIELSKHIRAGCEDFIDVGCVRVGEIDQGLVVRSGSDPAYCERSHETWIGVGCDEVVAVDSAVASHGSDGLDLEGVADLVDQVCANEVGELLDDLDELGADELTPVRIV